MEMETKKNKKKTENQKKKENMIKKKRELKNRGNKRQVFVSDGGIGLMNFQFVLLQQKANEHVGYLTMCSAQYKLQVDCTSIAALMFVFPNDAETIFIFGYCCIC